MCRCTRRRAGRSLIPTELRLRPMAWSGTANPACSRTPSSGSIRRLACLRERTFLPVEVWSATWPRRKMDAYTSHAAEWTRLVSSSPSSAGSSSQFDQAVRRAAALIGTHEQAFPVLLPPHHGAGEPVPDPVAGRTDFSHTRDAEIHRSKHGSRAIHAHRVSASLFNRAFRRLLRNRLRRSCASWSLDACCVRPLAHRHLDRDCYHQDP